MTPDQHAAAAEDVLKQLHATDLSSVPPQIATVHLLAGLIHATLASRQLMQPSLPSHEPTESDMRNALLQYDLLHQSDPDGALTVMRHLLACISDNKRRDSWVARLASMSGLNYKLLRESVNRLL